MARKDFEKSLETAKEVEITTTGRTSGREISNPVWFVRREDKLYLLPVGGSGSNWYRNLRKTPAVRLTAGRNAHTATARTITDRAAVDTVVANFRDKYGVHDVQTYYPDVDVAVE